MSEINFDLSMDAKNIDKKLSGLKWITPIFPLNPEKEIKFLKEVINILNNESKKTMVLSNYSFLSLVSNKNCRRNITNYIFVIRINR